MSVRVFLLFVEDEKSIPSFVQGSETAYRLQEVAAHMLTDELFTDDPSMMVPYAPAHADLFRLKWMQSLLKNALEIRGEGGGGGVGRCIKRSLPEWGSS